MVIVAGVDVWSSLTDIAVLATLYEDRTCCASAAAQLASGVFDGAGHDGVWTWASQLMGGASLLIIAKRPASWTASSIVFSVHKTRPNSMLPTISNNSAERMMLDSTAAEP